MGKCGFRRAGEFQDLADQRIDALNFVADDAGDFGVFISFQQEFCERFRRHQRILYFVRDAGGKDADTCQSIEPPEVHFDLSVPIQIVQQKNHAGFLCLADLVEGSSDLNADFGWGSSRRSTCRSLTDWPVVNVPESPAAKRSAEHRWYGSEPGQHAGGSGKLPRG